MRTLKALLKALVIDFLIYISAILSNDASCKTIGYILGTFSFMWLWHELQTKEND